MLSIVKRYRIVGREGAALLQDFRDFLLEKLQLYREFAVFRKSGGRSGDLGEEIMDYEMYMSGREGGMTTGAVYVYSVIDHSCNGYAHLLTVLIDLVPNDSEKKEAIISFLEERDFVSKYSSFKERPAGFKHYAPYLDSPPNLSQMSDEFRNPREKSIRANPTVQHPETAV